MSHDFELPPGRFIIGRSTECQLSLDDPLVSRKHAELIVTENTVELRDLGSRNGVNVNDEKISGTRVINYGDRITIGSQSIHIAQSQSDTHKLHNTGAWNAVPTSADPPVTIKRKAFQLIGGVAQKALAMGKADEALRLMEPLLDAVMQAANGKAEADECLADQAGLFAAKLAMANDDATWVNYVFELYSLRRKPCPASTIDELHGVFRKVKGIDVAALRSYVAILRNESSKLGPADRFLLHRIEGLERLVVG